MRYLVCLAAALVLAAPTPDTIVSVHLIGPTINSIPVPVGDAEDLYRVLKNCREIDGGVSLLLRSRRSSIVIPIGGK